MTSDERIEIAERMRGPFDVCDCVGHTYLNGTLYGMQVCARDEMDLRNGMRHLAELIDPTCHVREYGLPDEFRVVKGCSVCHCGWYEDVFGRPYRYCPHCGARVVTDDD